MNFLHRWLDRFLNPSPQPDMAFISDKGGRRYWLAWSEEGESLGLIYRRRIVGRVELEWQDGGRCLLKIIELLDPRLRGQGLGSGLLTHVIDRARAGGARFLYGRITQESHEATPYLVEFYQKHGFVVWELGGSGDRYTIELDLSLPPSLSTR